MKKPVPFDEYDLREYLSKFDKRTQDDFEIYIKLKSDDVLDNNSKPLSESLKKEISESLKESLGVELFENIELFNLLKLVLVYGDDIGFYKFEGIDSRKIIEIKDANGDTVYLSKGRFFDPVEDAINKELR